MKQILALILSISILYLSAQEIPLPEHPRPDFYRSLWMNLNGSWDFEFDSLDRGLNEAWYASGKVLSKNIVVPFPWGSPLSQVKDEADIAWYKRSIRVPNEFVGKRTFLVLGACDWETSVWLDGHFLGKHEGGYMPFEFDLTPYLNGSMAHEVTIRVDDKRRDFTLYGKQGYGNARGMWQTIYLEARGRDFIDAVHCLPDIDLHKVHVTVAITEAPVEPKSFTIHVLGEGYDAKGSGIISAGMTEGSLDIAIRDQHLWCLEDPYLYGMIAVLGADTVHTYFGMRKISAVNLPGTNIPYIAINNKPIYLQLALDQSYHPEGYYTFPSDQFMKEEILRSKSIGLNGIRTHIKPDLPRKLYWADKLGLLVMADLPNSWGEPTERMQHEAETTLRQMIKRDFNHPSIFSWIVFNETWGLTTKQTIDGKTKSQYLPETQQWVTTMYHLAKGLDPTRLVEDNSICCGRGHTETDINSWHEYLPGWAWDDHLKKITENDYAGSTFHFEKGYLQGNQPNINSECGNVWGYEGSTGDVDWSYDYHRMINTFRMYPKVAGWLYTEHHDVINEWNGYWRFDRSEKQTGLGEIFPGMTLNDLHSKYYLSPGNEITKNVQGGSTIDVPLYLSIYDDLRVNKFSKGHPWTIGAFHGILTLKNILIGMVIILFGVLEFTGFGRKPWRVQSVAAGGLLSGFLGGFSGHQGALRSAFLIRYPISKEVFIATGVAIACLVDITRLSVYLPNLVHGQLPPGYELVFIAIVAALCGAWVGNGLLKKLDINVIKKITAVFVITIGVAILLGIL